MGCDIHMHVELLMEGSDEWQHWNAPWVRRYYAMFAKMADVRNYDKVTPIAERRGMPDDASALTRWDSERMGRDGHSHSWLNRAELHQIQEYWEIEDHTRRQFFETDFMGGYLAGNTYTHELPAGIRDVRIVFWFDN